MPPVLFWTIYLLIRALGSVDARAVDSTIPSLPTSLPTSAISSFVIVDPSNATASQRCGDIDNCRTLDEIVVSCLVTILACVWFAVHRNIPAPSRKPEPMITSSIFRDVRVGTAQRPWNLVLAQKEPAIVFVVAVLAPEWILAWALRQALTAWRLTGKLKAAAILEQQSRNTTQGSGRLDGQSRRSRRHVEETQCWGMMSHAFFVAMGGFSYYSGWPQHSPRPLSSDEVVKLVEQGDLVLPTVEEISDKSKGDAFSKGVAIGQTLWFVTQCVARGAGNLPVTRLEVMTLAYTVMTVAMYIAWWHKPLNVSCAVRVQEEKVEVEEVEEVEEETGDSGTWIGRIIRYIIGSQDRLVDLHKCTHVPTFWAGNADAKDTLVSDAVALLVAMVFGAVHCIAWYSEFPSHLELQLWRYSAIAIIAVPVALVVVYLVAVPIARCLHINEGTTLGACYIPIAIIYIAARFILIILSFTSLQGLPIGAYQTVQWTTFIPHI